MGPADVIDTSAEGTCQFGNVTVKVGERLVDSETPCEECHCSTPPELTNVLSNSYCKLFRNLETKFNFIFNWFFLS